MNMLLPLTRDEVLQIISAVLTYNGYNPIEAHILDAKGLAIDFDQIVVKCERPRALIVRVVPEDIDSEENSVAAMRQRELEAIQSTIPALEKLRDLQNAAAAGSTT